MQMRETAKIIYKLCRCDEIYRKISIAREWNKDKEKNQRKRNETKKDKIKQIEKKGLVNV